MVILDFNLLRIFAYFINVFSPYNLRKNLFLEFLILFFYQMQRCSIYKRILLKYFSLASWKNSYSQFFVCENRFGYTDRIISFCKTIGTNISANYPLLFNNSTMKHFYIPIKNFVSVWLFLGIFFA
jgi:hypothetical protein